MIITRVKAEAAATVLDLPLSDLLTPEMVKQAYRREAAKAHPDAGGTTEAFARVDHAKEVLNRWLEKNETATPELDTKRCVRCHGAGKLKIQSGFRFYLVKCDTCHGTGDGSYDHDRPVE